MDFQLVHGSDEYNSQMTYFTTRSFTDDEKYLYFLSTKDNGCQNLYEKNLDTGEIKKLSDNNDPMDFHDYGRLKAMPGKGFGWPTIDTANRVMYYIQDRDMVRVLPDGTKSILFQIPENEYCSLPHMTTDGIYMCLATTDQPAMEGYIAEDGSIDVFCVDKKFLKGEIKSYINVYDMKTGELVKREPITSGWVTHIQFSPVDNNLILYNNEHATVDCGVRRVWLWDGKEHKALRTEGDGRFKDDWTCHEFWSEDGKYVYWHGRIHFRGQPYIGRYELATGNISEILLENDFCECYGHFSVNSDGDFVSDGYWGDAKIPENRPADAPTYPSEWLTVMIPDWEAKTVKYIPLGKHSTSWATQDAHPHPVFNKKGDTVYFTTDFGKGTRKIYKCKWR